MSAENSPYSTVLNRLNDTGEDRDFIRLLPGLRSQILLGKYQVDEPLNYSGSEAVLYLAHDSEARRFVIKLYRRRNGIKPGVVESLMRLENPHVAKILAAGNTDGYTFTVSPCYDGTSLDRILADGARFDHDTLKLQIIPAVLDGLNALHELGIVHKDLKPSNIMITPEDSGIRIIDFGVSSELDNSTLIITRTGKTPAYSAPETISGIFSPASDYFSFGITLFELMTGHTPFEDDQESGEEINRSIMIQKIEFPEDFDPDIRNLILGLTFRDISGRHDPSNPNRRWGYDEVRRWLANETVHVPGIAGHGAELSSDLEHDSDSGRFTYPYRFKGCFLDTHEALAVTLLKNFEEGLSELQRGHLSRHYELNDNSELHEKCTRTAEKIDALEEGDPKITALYTGLCYSLCSSVKGIYWKHLYFRDFRDFRDFINSVLVQIQTVLLENHSAAFEPDRYRNSEFVKCLDEMIRTSFLREHFGLFLDGYDKAERKKIFSLLDSALNKAGDRMNKTGGSPGKAVSSLNKADGKSDSGRNEKGEQETGNGELTDGAETVTASSAAVSASAPGGSNRSCENKKYMHKKLNQSPEQSLRYRVSRNTGKIKTFGEEVQGSAEFTDPANSDPETADPGMAVINGLEYYYDYVQSFSELMNVEGAAELEQDPVHADGAGAEGSSETDSDAVFCDIRDLLKFVYLVTRRKDFVVCLQSSSMHFENTEDFNLRMDSYYAQDPVKFIQILQEGKNSLSLMSGLMPDLKKAVYGFKLKTDNVLIMCDGQYVFKSLTEILDFDDKLWDLDFENYFIFRRRTEIYYRKIADKLKKTDESRYDKISTRYNSMFQIDGVIFRDPDDFELYIRQADAISPDFIREYLSIHRSGIIRALRNSRSDLVKEILGRYVMAVKGI